MPTPTPVPTRIPTPIPTSTPTSIPQPKFSQEEIHGFIERFAGQYGVDPNVLRHIATCESGFNAQAVNGPYVGLYQFGSSAWISNRVLMGEDASLDLRFNAEESAQTAAFVVSRGIKNIWPNCFP
jgi:soluble lytic murein transglycosylase-like protein